ncbi:unextended protein-like isoform X2 [Rhodnius prolixus]|uniref:unextended protein-like isoform X2 n=1 Tax=Rhodnius prolixus TaxID=13249 RepID=UPI003D18E2CD
MGLLHWISLVFYCLHFLSHTKGQIIGLQVEKYQFATEIKYSDNFIPKFYRNDSLTLRLYGNVAAITAIALTEHKKSCNYLIAHSEVIVRPAGNNMTLVDIIVPDALHSSMQVYICAMERGEWFHQGTEKRLSFIIEKHLLPQWLTIPLMVTCIGISALCNGLIVGIMSLDVTELNVLVKAGTQKQKDYARTILPIRKKANFLMVTLLLGTTISNSIFTLVTDSYLQSWATILIVTMVILLLCEILPSTIFTRFALSAGAKTICFPYFLMYISFPISFTLAKILDKILGEDMTMFTKAKLKEMVNITWDMQKQEKDIIAGALEMNTKTVEEVMTPLNDIYMLSINTYLDYNTIADILNTGYSRIPIYDGERSNIVNVLFTKDLILLDPEDRIPVKVLLKLTKLESLYIPAGTTLDKAFNIFKEDANKRHLALIYEEDLETSEQHKIIGLVTLEDIIEEVVQFEIVDEFDTITDNRSKRRRERYRLASHFLTMFSEQPESNIEFISPQLKQATLQFLVTNIDKFHPDIISPKCLQGILNERVMFQYNPKVHTLPKNKVFDRDVTNDSFIMIVEGRVEILIGKEKIKCESGPFFYFGLSNLNAKQVTPRSPTILLF